MFITSDGNKLTGYLQPVFKCLKYSDRDQCMDLTVEEASPLEIKEPDEMNFSEEEITERFFRETRHAKVPDWAWLCQNFTQSCGGDFEIKVDGDLFKAILSFNTI